jgi:NADH-quinone oxidoreductase subunit C
LSSADAPATTDAAPPSVSTPTITGDDQGRARLDALLIELGDDVLTSQIVRGGELLIRVTAGAWKRAAEICRAQGYNYFCYLSGIDWMPSTSPNPRASVSDELDTGDDEAPSPADDDEPEATVAAADPEPEADTGGLGYPTGVGGGDTRFQVLARLYSIDRHEGVTLKADLDSDAPRVATWSEVYPGADWCERETWEMYGFVFEGHPNLIKLYLPGEFEGFPLRKDFPLLSREVKPWPGLVDVEPMPEVPEVPEATEATEAAENGESAG